MGTKYCVSPLFTECRGELVVNGFPRGKRACEPQQHYNRHQEYGRAQRFHPFDLPSGGW